MAGAPRGLLANVLIYLPFTILLARIPYTGHARHDGPPRQAPSFGLGEALRVFGQIRADRRIVTMIVPGATSFFVGNALQAQMPQTRIAWERTRRARGTAFSSPPIRRAPWSAPSSWRA